MINSTMWDTTNLMIRYDVKCGRYELRLKKPVSGVSEQIRHKPGCTTTDDQRL